MDGYIKINLKKLLILFLRFQLNKEIFRSRKCTLIALKCHRGYKATVEVETTNDKKTKLTVGFKGTTLVVGFSTGHKALKGNGQSNRLFYNST